MNNQLEFKEEAFVVNLRQGIYPVYRFLDGNVMRRKDYDDRVWEGFSFYSKYDHYLQQFGENCSIESQTRVVKTLEEAKEALKELKLKQIAEKEEELEILRRKIEE